MNDAISKQMYLEREFHRVSLERKSLRFWSWFWFVGCVVGWTALVAVAFKAGIIGK